MPTNNLRQIFVQKLFELKKKELKAFRAIKINFRDKIV